MACDPGTAVGGSGARQESAVSAVISFRVPASLEDADVPATMVPAAPTQSPPCAIPDAVAALNAQPGRNAVAPIVGAYEAATSTWSEQVTYR